MKIAGLFWRSQTLCSFSTDATGQLDVLWHNGHSFGVDSAQVSVLEKANQVGFRSFLKSGYGRWLESQVGLEVLSYFTDKTLKGQLSDEKFGCLLVFSDFTKSDCSWSVSVRFLHSSGSRGTLASSLSGQLLSWGFAASRFSGSLLGTSHFSMNLSRRLKRTDASSNLALCIFQLYRMIDRWISRIVIGSGISILIGYLKSQTWLVLEVVSTQGRKDIE